MKTYAYIIEIILRRKFPLDDGESNFIRLVNIFFT